MAPPVWGYRDGINGLFDAYFNELHLLVPKRSRRRHDREMKIARRMRDARDLMHLYEPESGWPPWFVPGRFAKIHPMRVCSCEMCKGDKLQRKRDRAAAKRELRRGGDA